MYEGLYRFYKEEFLI